MLAMTAYPLHLGLNWSGKVVYITAILLYALFIQCVYFPCNVNLIFMKKGPWTRYNVTIFFSIFGNFINYKFVFFRDVHTVSVSTVLGSGIPETVKCFSYFRYELTCRFIRCAFCSLLEPLSFHFGHYYWAYVEN